MTTTDGDCFRVAFELARELFPVATLCHGTPRLRADGPHKGKRYAHAWVEVDDLVLDFANGRRFQLQRESYYLVGSIGAPMVRRYTVPEALELIRQTMQWGPWGDFHGVDL